MAETTSAPSLREWVLVPIFPTEAMMDAGASECRRNAGVIDPVVHIWDAMIAAAPPTTLSEAAAFARAEGWQPIETLPYHPMADYDFDLPGDANAGLGYATDTDTGEILFLVWWTCTGPGRSKVTHWRPKIQGPPTPAQTDTTSGGRTDG